MKASERHIETHPTQHRIEFSKTHVADFEKDGSDKVWSLENISYQNAMA